MPSFSLTITTTPPDTVASVSIVSLTRSDTGATPGGVTLPIVLTVVNVGSEWVATGTFSDGSQPEFYNYGFVITYGDGSAGGTQYGVLPGVVPAAGYYTDQARLQQKFGVENIRQWSNADNDTLATNTTSVQAALSLADDQINQFFSNGPYVVPLTPVPFSATNWANVLTAYELYTNRGIFDKANDVGARLNKMRGDMLREMASYRGGALTLQCQRRWPTPTSPVAM